MLNYIMNDPVGGALALLIAALLILDVLVGRRLRKMRKE